MLSCILLINKYNTNTIKKYTQIYDLILILYCISFIIAFSVMEISRGIYDATISIHTKTNCLFIK